MVHSPSDLSWRRKRVIEDKVTICNIKSITKLEVIFDFTTSNILVLTGKNGLGKTSLVKSFALIDDPTIFQKSSSLNSVKKTSQITFEINGYEKFSYAHNPTLEALDTKDILPPRKAIVAELSIPYGRRFQQFSLISKYDNEIRTNIASSEYSSAIEMIKFLKNIYSTDKFDKLKVTTIHKHKFYFILQDNDYYIREDHLSSGEFFLIQLFRLISSKASLVLVDEVDVALDASAQVKLFPAIKHLLSKHNTRVVLISHSLAFMSTVEAGGLYYLENSSDSISIENRSYGYIKSDLYGFRGKDRYILTEDEALSGFIKYLIKNYIQSFYEYDIIEIGGKPQISSIIAKNDADQIFGSQEHVIVIVDGDIYDEMSAKWSSNSSLVSSPVDDLEAYIWDNKEQLLSDVQIKPFQPAHNNKKTAKTYWGKVISSGKKTRDDLYLLITENNIDETNKLIEIIKTHLSL